MTNQQKEQIRTMRLQGIGYIKIGETLGISDNTVRSFCRRNGLGDTAKNTVSCKQCGKLIKVIPKRKPRIFCSDVCRTAWWNSHPDCVHRKAVYLSIAKHLNEEGIPSRFGVKWNQSVIGKILSNYTYTGNLILQKTFRENHITKKTIINNGELPKYHAEDAHDAIIPLETWQAVQAEKARRAARFHKKPTPQKAYPFSGLLVCDNCGKNYRRKTTKTGIVWVCSTFNTQGKAACASKQIPEETLQTVTADVLGQPDFTENLLRSMISSIRVCNENVLVFRFYNGSEVTRKWKDRSRSQSWTPEMKAAARQKTLERRNHNA